MQLTVCIEELAWRRMSAGAASRADGLVDELHLFVFPLAQGAGMRLFADSGPAIKLALAGSQAYSNGALHLTYRPAA